MKLSLPIFLGLAAQASAFTTFYSPTIVPSSTFLQAAELTPEPEGGEELTKVTTSMEGSRMKNMGAADEEGVYQFWLSATADGAQVKQLRQQTEREASKKAGASTRNKCRNTPGKRRGIKIYDGQRIPHG